MDADAVLPVLPWTATALAVVLLVGLQVPPPRGPRRALSAGPSPTGSRSGAVVLGALLLALAAAARLGAPSELDNPVPPLVLGLGVPALLVLPLLLAPLLPRPAWRSTDSPDDVRPALPLALLVVVALVAVPERTRPDVLAALLAGYGVLLLAVGVAAGLPAVGRTDALGLLARWSALGPRLPAWAAPRGASALLVLVLAGAWAERASRTSAWTAQTPDRAALLLLLVVAVALAAAPVLLLRRYGAAAVLLPLAAGAVVAGGLRRALVSAQLLLPGSGVTPDPLGVAGGQALALGAAVLGGSAAAAVLARRAGDGADRLAGLGAVLAASAVTCWLVLQP